VSTEKLIRITHGNQKDQQRQGLTAVCCTKFKGRQTAFSNRKRWLFGSAGLLFILFVAGIDAAHGEAWVIAPQVSLGVGADDNFFLNAAEPETVTAPRIAGDLALRRLTETMNLEGFVRLDYVTYSGVPNERLPDSSNQLYRFNGLFKNSDQTSQFGLDTTLRRDTLNRTVRLTFEPDDVGVDPDPDVDESLVRRSIDRDRWYFKPSWTGRISERMSLGLRYEYFETNYESTLVDFTDQLLTGEWFYQLSERDRINVSVIGELYEAENGNEFNNQRLVFGIEHRFTETTRGKIEVGGIRTDFKTGAESGVNEGYIARLSGSQLVGVTRFDARIGRNRYPSGSGDIVQTDEAVGNMSHRLGARTILSFRARLFQNESLLRDNPRTNRRFMSLRPRLRWRMTRWWYLDFLYQYRRQKRDIEPESADSNSVLLSVVYAQPKTLD
jgi:hypothetical protein